MELIDDEGRLFGTVNVIDALVVLVVLAVVVAGAALVVSDDPEPEPDLDTTHATLDLGTQPDYIVSEINEGDAYSPGGDDRITITDVHLTPQGNEQRVVLRVELRGELSGGSIQYDGAPPRLGRTLEVVTDLYQVDGQVRAVGGEDTLDREETTVVLRDTVDAADAREIAPGEEIRLADRTVATVEDVAVYAEGSPTRRVVVLEAALDAHRQQGELRFGGTPVRRGQTVDLPAGDYDLSGTIERVGDGLDRGEADVLLSDVVDVETAESIAEGDVIEVDGHRTATVESVTAYGTSNPDRNRVFVGVSIATLEHRERPQFGDTYVQQGSSISLSTDTYDLSGTIERVGTTEERGAPATRTVTLRMDEVHEDMAAAIRPGQTERSSGETIARVTDVDVEPSVILIRGEEGELGVYDHPIDRDVTITAELDVRETTAGVRFKGETIRQGSTVTLDLGTVTVEATVVSVGG
ncbi:hypothetical protein AArcSl_1841 [Halalkaliarchaeum desulfuricum]|uniref:DUF4330 domain-containing protein n=1 Tax=Halalkaliarchaeum desulfuricum TaxID=2055893 RepID=A0A343TK45_9EURY|nr:DUF4330 family protein [Halalkaliarchaeum desulfuricum]AUX09467.1 hypothetical protein AArcSl_1841 [Halalkaliarchaeum desulfuricum]